MTLPRPGQDQIFVDCSQVIKVHVFEEGKPEVCRDDVCGNIAEVFERYYHEDKQGRIYYYRTRCLDGHILDVRVTESEYKA